MLLRIGAVESSLTDAREEQEKLRDRLEESFDVVAAKLDMLTRMVIAACNKGGPVTGGLIDHTIGLER